MAADNKTIEPEEKELQSLFEKRILKECRKKSRIRLCRDLIITAVVVFILFSVIAGIAVVQGDSMKPNLTNGSIALFYRLSGTYKKNDIILFKPSGKNDLLIKRVVAVAGDKVDIDDKAGTLLINGNIEQDDTIKGKTYPRDGSSVKFPLTVPNGCVFVLGDNREVALDSRNLGTIDVKSLMGKVVFEIKKLTD
jgi:signal peptidase I